MVEFVNLLHDEYIRIINKYDVISPATVTDAVMVVSGYPTPFSGHSIPVSGYPKPGTVQAAVMANMALEMRDMVTDLIVPHLPNVQLFVRIGRRNTPLYTRTFNKIIKCK